MDINSSPIQTYIAGIPSIDGQSLVAWTREEAYRMGEIGFTTNFPNPHDVFKPRNIGLNVSREPSEDELAIANAARALHIKICTMKQRQAMMESNVGLLMNAHAWVDRKLLAAGRQRREDEYRPLRVKVVELFEIEYPTPLPNYVEVWVKPRPAMGSKYMQVNLPLQTSVAEAYKLLEGAMKIESCIKDPFQSTTMDESQGGLWKYQLLARDLKHVVNKRSIRLETDSDYQKMIQLTTKEGAKAPLAVLTQDTAINPTTETAVSDARVGDAKAQGTGSVDHDYEESNQAEDFHDCNYPEPLDDDGNPYFDPDTDEGWARVYEAYNKKYEAMMDEDL